MMKVKASRVGTGDGVENSELELGRGGFEFDIFENNASVEADAQATGLVDNEPIAIAIDKILEVYDKEEIGVLK